METHATAMPRVSRLAADDHDDMPGSSSDEAASQPRGSIGSGPSVPLTLRHDHAQSDPSAEQAAAPSLANSPAASATPPVAGQPAPAVTASIVGGIAAGSGGPPAVARPISVARLVDLTSSPSIGGLVGSRSLTRRAVQRSAEGGATGSPATRTSASLPSAVGPLAGATAGASAKPAAASPSVAETTIGDFASTVSSAGAFESGPTSFALPARKSASAAAAGLPVVSRPVQRATVQQLPAPVLPLAPTRGPSQASVEATAMAVAQRAIDARAQEAPTVEAVPAVQREVVVDEMGGAGSPPSSGGGPGGTGGGGASSGQSPAELDQLASKLWSRLRLQLRRELITDRERAGMLTDLH
jgi:hypothetical protein